MNARLTRSLTIFCTRIQKLLRAHLEESGWVDDLKDLAEGENEGWKRQRLEADLPSHGIISLLFNHHFLSQNLHQLHHTMTMSHCDVSCPNTVHTKRKRNCQYTMPPAGTPPHGLRCVISRKSSGSGCTKPREPCQTNQWERSWWGYSSLLSLLSVFFLFHIAMHLPLQIQGLSDVFRASLTNDLSFDTGMVSDNVKRDVMLEIESVLDREVDQAWGIALRRRLWWEWEMLKASDGRAEGRSVSTVLSGKIGFVDDHIDRASLVCCMHSLYILLPEQAEYPV